MRNWLPAVIVAGFVVSPPAATDVSPGQALVQNYCLGCHNTRMKAAGLGTVSPGEDPGTESETLEAVEFALKLGDDINAVNNDGDTAMHGAAYKNAPLVVKYLAEHGADIGLWNRQNKHGWTPLIIAEGRRFGNFKPSPPTVAAILEVMQSAGVAPPPTAEALDKNSDSVKKKP
jgi:hypothetical protein